MADYQPKKNKNRVKNVAPGEMKVEKKGNGLNNGRTYESNMGGSYSKGSKRVDYDGTGYDMTGTWQREEQQLKRSKEANLKNKKHSDAELTANAKRLNNQLEEERAAKAARNQASREKVTKKKDWQKSQRNNSKGYKNMLERRNDANIEKYEKAFGRKVNRGNR